MPRLSDGLLERVFHIEHPHMSFPVLKLMPSHAACSRMCTPTCVQASMRAAPMQPAPQPPGVQALLLERVHAGPKLSRPLCADADRDPAIAQQLHSMATPLTMASSRPSLSRPEPDKAGLNIDKAHDRGCFSQPAASTGLRTPDRPPLEPCLAF